MFHPLRRFVTKGTMIVNPPLAREKASRTMHRHDPQYSTALELAIELVCSIALSCTVFLLLIGVLL